jgi:hypothetical protein
MLISGIISVMASSVLVATALTWGGDEYAWTSAPVLATLIIGAVGLAAFLAYEFLLAKNPLVSTHELRLRNTWITHFRFLSR